MKFSIKLIILVFISIISLNNIFAQSWTTISVSGNIQKIAFNQQIGVAVGYNGTILKTTDGGLSFNSVSSGVSDNLVDVKFVGNNTFVACGWIWGSHGIVLKSTDNGNTWNSVISLNGQYSELFGINNYNNDTIFVSGTNQLIKSYNGFTSYTVSNFPNGYQYRSLVFNNNLILMAHAGSITMRKSNNFGNSYSDCMIQPTSNMLRDMVFQNNKIFAIGDNGAFCSSSDGDNWNMISTANLNFKSIHELNGILYTCTPSEIFELSQNGSISSIYNSVGINSTGKSNDKLFALGSNFIAYKSICTNPTATITPQGNTTFCQGGSVNLNASTGSNYTYEWYKDGQLINGAITNIYQVTSSGNYTVKVIDGPCYATSSATNVTVNTNPTVTLSSIPSVVYKTSAPIQLVGNPTGGTFSGDAVSGSTFTPANASLGQKVISYSYTSQQGCSGSASQTTIVADTVGNVCSTYDTLIITVHFTTGINANTSNSIKFYPNPTNDILNIDNGNYQAMSGYSIKIVSLTGAVIYNQPITTQSVQISMNDFGTTGLYFAQIIDPNNAIVDSKKIVLQ